MVNPAAHTMPVEVFLQTLYTLTRQPSSRTLEAPHMPVASVQSRRTSPRLLREAGRAFLVRMLLVHGARSVVQQAARRSDALSRWKLDVQARRGTNIAVFALANKIA
jgi:hypothetical protein